MVTTSHPAYRSKYSDRLLTVAFVFVIFFIATMLLIPVLTRLFRIDTDTRDGLLAISAIQNILAFILPSIAAAWMISKSPAAVLRLNRAPSISSLLGVVITFALAMPALNQIIYWNANIRFPESMETISAALKELEDQATEVTNVMLSTNSIGGLVVNILLIAVLTAIGEEFFFRGALQTTAASGGSPHTAIWVVALLFSAFHFQVFGFVPRFLLGAWFGYLLFWTRSIYVPVFAHALNNGIVVASCWWSNRGHESNYELIGVTEYGFATYAFLSAVATVAFLYFGRSLFSPSKKSA